MLHQIMKYGIPLLTIGGLIGLKIFIKWAIGL
jgi:hypothetical protein